MSAPKWTPGPWEIGDPNDKTGADIGIHSSDWVIADMCKDVCKLTVNQQANAHLITAAPELYAALHNLLNRIKHDPEAKNWWPNTQEEARAALAKARGEQA